MTLDRPAVTIDTHPRRPERLKAIAAHWLCCVVWRVPAGSCSGDRSRAEGAFSVSVKSEKASDQLIDFSEAFKQLAPRLQKVVRIIINHGPTDVYDGDPLRHGTLYDDPETFWVEYGRLLDVSVDEWYKAQEMEDLAFERMARSLGWRPIEQAS